MLLWRTLGILTIVCFVESSEPEHAYWPVGSYGIPQAASGCPYANDFQWLIGRRYQDTENTASNNYRSAEFHLDGEVGRTGIARSFCVKTDTSTDNERCSWPPGKYCIYKKGGSCPVNLSSGFIKWDDEDMNNENKKTGTLPDGVYDDDTKIEFCCRTDGDKNDPITLPTLKPFFLLAHDSAECQQVKWATVHVEWIRFDNEDRGNSDDQGGSYPHGAGIRNHMIHYCYYQGCNETLTGITGTFNSPNYPRQYPDGQYCSWRITVSPAHQIHLTFTDFKLQQDNNTDSVNVYDGENASGEVLGVFYGGHPPPEEGIYSSSNHILVIFKSDKKDAYTGFYASYNAVECLACKSTRIMETSSSPSLRTNVPSKLTATFTADTSSFEVPEISSSASGRLATSEWPIMISKSSHSERRTKKLNRAIFNSRIKNMALSPTSLKTEPIVSSTYPIQAKIVSSVAGLVSTANEKSKPAVSSGAMITTVKGTISSPNLYLAILPSSMITPSFKKGSLTKATPSLSTSRSRVKVYSSTSHLPEKTSSSDRELETTTSYYKETELSSSYTGQTSAGTRHSKPPPALLFHETSATSATMNITSSPNVMEVTSSWITYLTTLDVLLTTSSSSYKTVTFADENIYVTSRSQVVKIAASSPTLSSSSPSPSSSSPSPLLSPSLPSSSLPSPLLSPSPSLSSLSPLLSPSLPSSSSPSPLLSPSLSVPPPSSSSSSSSSLSSSSSSTTTTMSSPSLQSSSSPSSSPSAVSSPSSSSSSSSQSTSPLPPPPSAASSSSSLSSLSSPSPSLPTLSSSSSSSSSPLPPPPLPSSSSSSLSSQSPSPATPSSPSSRSSPLPPPPPPSSSRSPSSSPASSLRSSSSSPSTLQALSSPLPSSSSSSSPLSLSSSLSPTLSPSLSSSSPLPSPLLSSSSSSSSSSPTMLLPSSSLSSSSPSSSSSSLSSMSLPSPSPPPSSSSSPSPSPLPPSSSLSSLTRSLPPPPPSSSSSTSPSPSPLPSSSSSPSPLPSLPPPPPSSSSSSSLSSTTTTTSLPSPSPLLSPPSLSTSSSPSASSSLSSSLSSSSSSLSLSPLFPMPSVLQSLPSSLPSSSSSSLSSSSLPAPAPSSPAPLLPTTVSLPLPSPPSSSLSSSSSSSSSSLSSSLSSPPLPLPPTPSSKITTPFVASSNSSIREMVLPSSMSSYRRKEMKSAHKEMISITTEQSKPTIINLGTVETTETEPEVTSPFTELTPTPTLQLEAVGAAKKRKGLNLIVILVPLLLVLLLVLLVLAALCYCKRKKAKEGN